MKNDVEHLIAMIDQKIHTLTEAKRILTDADKIMGSPLERRGRPRKVFEQPEPPVKRKLSAEARKRIAAAQKKRWATYRSVRGIVAKSATVGS